MATTTKSLTEKQIRTLRREAMDAGDYPMVVICDLALAGEIDVTDYTVLDAPDARRIARMTRDEAYTAIVRAINSAEAQAD